MRPSMNYVKVPVMNVQDFGQATFDKAAPAELFYGSRENPVPIKEWKGIYNMDKRKIATVASEDYQIIQHKDVQDAVTQTLSRLNLDVKGVVRNFGDSFRADLVFQNAGVEVTDDASGIQIGIRVVNSYNKATSFRLEMFGFRRVCQNGMTFGAKSFGIVENTIHYGEREKNLAEIGRITEGFIHKVINSSATMQAYVNLMIGDSMEYTTCIKIVRALVKAEKHQEELIKRLTDAKTRWELYNAVTNYATHGEQLTPHVQTYLEGVSRRIMEKNGAELDAEANQILEKAAEIKN